MAGRSRRDSGPDPFLGSAGNTRRGGETCLHLCKGCSIAHIFTKQENLRLVDTVFYGKKIRIQAQNNSSDLGVNMQKWPPERRRPRKDSGSDKQ